MTDHRLPENRQAYFDALYRMNLQHGVMPGLVYLYMPELARRHGWDEEQKLWFAFLNGMTQNPITSMVMMAQLPRCPVPDQGTLLRFADWFEREWARLQFDTDRRYQKKDTVAAIRGYAEMVKEHGSQQALLGQPDYASLWRTMSAVPSFGRLATFSYLEYVRIMGHGADCDDLMFGDLSGSRSHRNGMLLLAGHDELVMDKRMAGGGFKGKYKDLGGMAALMDARADCLLASYRDQWPAQAEHVSRFTLESNLCTFKNAFFGRRYPGVYADMAQERIVWAEEAGHKEEARVFRSIREELLPKWLRCESTPDGLTIKQRAAMFPETGRPCRAEHFLKD